MERKDKLFFGLVIICALLLLGLLLFMGNETAYCVKNPFVYGAERMGEVDCSCKQYINPSCPAKFSFNETTFSATPTICQGVEGLTTMPRMSDVTFE